MIVCGSRKVIAKLKTNPGDQIGDYRLIEYITKGRCGSVWKAQGPNDNLFAIQVLRRTREAVSQSDRKLAVSERIGRNENICYVYEEFRIEETRYLVMDLISGIDMSYHGEAFQDADPGQRAWALLSPMLGVTQGLSEAHAKGVSHGNLDMPENIMIRPDFTGVIVDYGLGFLFDPSDSEVSEFRFNLDLSGLTKTWKILGIDKLIEYAGEVELDQVVEGISDFTQLNALIAETLEIIEFKDPKPQLAFQMVLDVRDQRHRARTL